MLPSGWNMYMPKNELTHPSQPIKGQSLLNLKAVLESRIGGGEVRDLDLAMLMNVPVNRLSQLKRAQSSVFVLGNVESEPDGDGEDGADEVPSLRPSQAILTRLLLKHPEYAPLPVRASNVEILDLIAPVMDATGGTGKKESSAQPRKLGFAPLFGRSYISSYKMLAEGDSGTSNTGLAVVRLQMLIIGKFAQLYKSVLSEFVSAHPELAQTFPAGEMFENGWELLRQRDYLTDWMSDSVYASFVEKVHEEWRKWFSECYLEVLRDEAISRDIEPQAAIQKGKWTNTSPVTDEEFARYSRATKPILGRSDSLFSMFRESFQLTSAEAYWALGIQIKAFYRFRQRANQRIDAATSILVRYLYRYPEDIRLFVEPPPAGSEILALIQKDDPEFRLSQLAPLFGASRVMSYGFANDQLPCPFFARRLATIFHRQSVRGRPIYQELRECVEDEIVARGLDRDQFWRDGRWHH